MKRNLLSPKLERDQIDASFQDLARGSLSMVEDRHISHAVWRTTDS